MGIVKEVSIETIKWLPDGCSVEDMMYDLNFVVQVFEGIKDAETGRMLTTEELLKRVEQWAK